MKKLLSLSVILASTMFGMVSCGSGGDNDGREPMTVQQFKGASRQFEFDGFSEFTIRPTGISGDSGIGNSDVECRTDGYFIFGRERYRVTLIYTITNISSTDGSIVEAKISMSIVDSNMDELNNNASFMATFGLDQGSMETNESSYTLRQAPAVFYLDYRNWQSTSEIPYRINDKNGGFEDLTAIEQIPFFITTN